MALDEVASGEAEPVEIEETPDPAAPEPEAPKTLTLTPDELQQHVKASVMSTVEDLRRQDLETQQQTYEHAQRHAYEQQRAAIAPETVAITTLDARMDMVEEALNLYPDATPEQRKAIKAELAPFKTLGDVKSAVGMGLHKKLARGAMAEFIDKGEYTPKRFRSVEAPTVTPPPGAPSPSASDRLSPRMAAEVKEMESLMGVKFTEAELRNYVSGGNYA
jgi:hypothetical protein